MSDDNQQDQTQVETEMSQQFWKWLFIAFVFLGGIATASQRYVGANSKMLESMNVVGASIDQMAVVQTETNKHLEELTSSIELLMSEVSRQSGESESDQ